MEFELVVPAYNEAKNLPLLIERAAAAATAEGFTPDRFNLVVVQNGSTDDSAAVLARLKTQDFGPWFRVVTVAKNQGYGFGLKAGLASAKAATVAWSHADLQCDPRDAFRAKAVLASTPSPALVKGTRSGRNWKDWMVSRVFETIAGVVLGLHVFDVNAQPKVFPRAFLAELERPPDTFGFDLYALYRAAKAGYVLKTVPVAFPGRLHGVSKWASTFFGRYKTILGMIRYMVTLARTEGRL